MSAGVIGVVVFVSIRLMITAGRADLEYPAAPNGAERFPRTGAHRYTRCVPVISQRPECAMLATLLNINPERIAVAELFGVIGSPSKTSEYVRMLRAIEENRRIRALVIDIDSPGGGAGASETIYRSVAKIAKQKPVVACITGTGASGAYMAACGATKVVAVPMAVVGSIGVISMRPMLYDLLEKIGVRMEVTKAGRLKDMFSNFREPTPEEREKEQSLLNSFYDRFVTARRRGAQAAARAGARAGDGRDLHRRAGDGERAGRRAG